MIIRVCSIFAAEMLNAINGCELVHVVSPEVGLSIIPKEGL